MRAGRLDDVEAGADALGVEIDRLLAEDRLAGARGAFDQIGVHVGRRADRDRVDILGDARIASIAATWAPVASASACGGGAVGVGDQRDLRNPCAPRHCRVNLADPPGADDPESHAFLPRGRHCASREPRSKKEYTFHIDL